MIRQLFRLPVYLLTLMLSLPFRLFRRKPTLTDKIVNERISYEQSKHFLLKQIDRAKTAKQYQLALDQAYEHGKREREELRELTDLRQSYKTLSDYYSSLSLNYSKAQEKLALTEQFEVAYHNAHDRIDKLTKELHAEKQAHAVTREDLATYATLARKLQRECDEATAYSLAITKNSEVFPSTKSKPISFMVGDTVYGKVKTNAATYHSRWELTPKGWCDDHRVIPYEEVIEFDVKST